MSEELPDQSIDKLKQDALEAKVSILGLGQLIIASELQGIDLALFEKHDIPPKSEDWTMDDLEKIESILSSEYTDQDLITMHAMLQLIYDLAKQYGNTKKLSMKECILLLQTLHSDPEKACVVHDFAQMFACDAAYAAMELFPPHEDEKFLTDEEQEVSKHVTQEITQFVRDEILRTL